MSINNDYDFICQAKESHPQLSHASNIIIKYNSNLSNEQKQALISLIPKYAEYLKNMLNLDTYDKKSIDKKVDFINAYYNFMHSNQLDRAFSAQGKFRPTILEEFLFLLFRNFVEKAKAKYDEQNVLDSGAVKAYSNIYFKAKNFADFIASPEIGVNEKDQDYAIYRTFNISINNANPMQIRIPAIAIEAKTYIDKTMLDSIIATAEKIKSGNPHTRFIAVTERYEVSSSVDPAYSRIDQIYVLRNSIKRSEWTDINKDVVWRMFEETLTHLKRPWSDIRTRIEEEGVII